MSAMKDKTALVTGGSSGIGAATAEKLASLGMKVMLAARRKERLEALKEQITAAGGTAEYIVMDVSRRSDVAAGVKHTIETFGAIDVLFNNAGVMPLSFMDKCRVEEWDQMIDVNIKGLLYVIAATLPHMLKADSGHIINVASVAGHKVFHGSAVYCGTKFAVRAISEGLRAELAEKSKVRVTIISPGAVATELTNAIKDDDVMEYFSSMQLVPLDPGAIAEAVAYAIAQPADVEVNEITIRPTRQAL